MISRINQKGKLFVISQIPRFTLGIVQFKPTYVPKTLDTRLEGFLVGFLQNDSHLTFSTNNSHPSNYQRKNLSVLSQLCLNLECPYKRTQSLLKFQKTKRFWISLQEHNTNTKIIDLNNKSHSFEHSNSEVKLCYKKNK